MATDADYAKLADAAYQNSGAPEGWERLGNADPNPVGYDGAAFGRVVNGVVVEVVVAHRGTEPTTGDGDWTANGQMAQRQIPNQYQYQYAQQFLNNVRNANFDVPISITGHSLGGSLAQLQAAQTGLTAVTFNPYGAKQLIPALNGRYENDRYLRAAP